MPPIRKGDGTPVTPKGISQIRTGDGRILFDGDAIPDSVVDNFETQPDGPYETDTDGLEEFWNGPLNNYSRAENGAVDGSFAVSLDNDADDGIYSLSGLPRYPEKGDTFSTLIRDNGDTDVGFAWGLLEDNGNIVGYCTEFREDDNAVRLGRVTDWENSDYTQLTSFSASISSGTWYEFEVDWKNDDTHEVTVYELDNGDRGSSIGSDSFNDDTYTEGVGVGIGIHTGSGTFGTFIDQIQVIE